MVFPEPDHPPPGEDVPLIDLGDSSGTYHPTTLPPVAGSCHDASVSTFPAHNTTLGDTDISDMVHRQPVSCALKSVKSRTKRESPLKFPQQLCVKCHQPTGHWRIVPVRAHKPRQTGHSPATQGC